MAFALISNAWATANDKTSGSSIVSGVWGAEVPADSLVLVFVAKDNAATADAETSEVTSVTDTQGNTYTFVKEFCNAQGSANAGATISLYKSVTTTALTTSDTVTANFSDSRTASAIWAAAFSKGSGTTVDFTGTGTLANDGADAGSLSSSGLTNGTEYLTARGVAIERDRVGFAPTVTSSWSKINTTVGTTGGSNASNMTIWFEYIISSSGTSRTSDPATSAHDQAAIIVSFYEVAGSTTHTVTKADINYGGQTVVSNSKKNITVTKADINYGGQTVRSNPTTMSAITMAAINYGGQTVNVNAQRLTTVTMAAINYAGQTVVTNAKRLITVTMAAIDYAGQSVVTRIGTTHTAIAGVINYAGQTVITNAKYLAAVTAGVINYAGQTLVTNAQRLISVTMAAINYGGQTINVNAQRLTTVAAGVINYAGQTVISNAKRLNTVINGAIAYTGQVVTTNAQRLTSVVMAAINYAGQVVNVNANRLTTVANGTIIYQGQTVTSSSGGGGGPVYRQAWDLLVRIKQRF